MAILHWKQGLLCDKASFDLTEYESITVFRTNSVTKKQMINAWQKYKIRTGFEPGIPGRKANTITSELKRILSNAVVRYCI